MANNYTISFRSLRAGIDYTLSIGGGTGNAIALKGASQPFVTEEDSNEDQFQPMRCQSGKIVIVDDGKAANGTTAFDWKDLIPATDTSRPVTLTAMHGSTSLGTIWQGFIQAQSFSGELYGNPQEREFPVQCPLSVLSKFQAPTNQNDVRNIAYLVQYVFQQLPSPIEFDTFVFQGGTDAQAWLMKVFDWLNFVNITDDGIKPKYNLQEILTDVCQFWGWTVRTWRKQVIFTCSDDRSTEPNALVLTAAQLATLAGGNSAGTTPAMFTSLSVGNIFASTDVDDCQTRGASKATVKSDCNAASSMIQFAPQQLRDTMESGGYTWVQPDPDVNLVGYFTTPQITSFDVQEMKGSAVGGLGAFCRRQIYSREDTEDADICDIIMIKGNATGSMLAHIETTHDRLYGGGSIKMSGSIKLGAEDYTPDTTARNMLIAVGIGPSYNSNQTKWFYIMAQSGTTDPSYGWGTTHVAFRVTSNFHLCYFSDAGGPLPYGIYGDYPAIPVDYGMYGKIFVDFYGCDGVIGIADKFEIANFKLEYSRDAAVILGERARTVQKDRKSSREYVATNSNKGDGDWNADCIFASDNNMEYGYGLLMNPMVAGAGGGFMEKVRYNNGMSEDYAEQHLANRVATYCQASKRLITAPLRSNEAMNGVAVRDINPRHLVTLDSTTAHPIAISHDYYNDVTTITLLQQ